MIHSLPSDEQFLEYLEIASGYKNEQLAAMAETTKPHKEDLTEFFTFWYSTCASHSSALNKTYTSKWLDSQSSFIRAVKALTDKHKKSPEEKFLPTDIVAAKVASALERYAAPSNEYFEKQRNSAFSKRFRSKWSSEQWAAYCERERSDEYREKRFRQYLSRHALLFRWGLQKELVRALHRYYSRAVFDDLKKREIVQDALMATSEILKITNGPLAKATAALPGSEPLDLARLRKEIDRLQSQLETLNASLIPNVRRDETLRERALLWDLSCTFRRFFDADKPTALFYLLSLPGIEHPLDQRRVERIIKGWATNRERRPAG